MNYQFENLVLSSFALWLDNRLLTLGSGFTNIGTKLYPIDQKFNGLYSYSTPFNQLVSDFSIPGAQVPTGLYVNGVFTPIGQGGLVDINYEKGQAYFSSQQNGVISGDYSFKELNVVLPKLPQLRMLFDRKLDIRPTRMEQYTGIIDNHLSYPAVFVRQYGSTTKPFAIGGLDETMINIGVYVFSESQYQLDAVCGILGDSTYKYFPLLGLPDMPFNVYGGFKNGIPYNYTGLTYNRVQTGSGVLIKEVNVTDFTRRIYSQVQSLPPDVYFSIAEFTVFKDRLTS